MKHTPPTVERLQAMFSVDELGRLVRKTRQGQAYPAGSVAGSLNSRGYIKVSIDRAQYAAHRLVFAITNGRWPVDEIDHINCIKSDNRPCNLREAQRHENQCNCPLRANNSSGFKGVSWDRATNNWRAQIRLHGVVTYLGGYESPQLAAEAYKRAASEIHGDFARPE